MASPTTASPNVSALITSLGGNDAAQKMAAFKLQTLTNDPSFVEQFAAQGGALMLRDVILRSSGNTLAYSLSSFARLLEFNNGWNGVDALMIEKAIELVVNQPLVNILRGAMALLVSVISRPLPGGNRGKLPDTYMGGFRALKPALKQYPQFLEMLVSRLNSADHALCAHALQLVNALMRDAITLDDETEWPKFVQRIQDLGVIKAVYALMQSSVLSDIAQPVLEFQQLTKIQLSKWRDMLVNFAKPEHRRTIKAIHLASNPPEKDQSPSTEKDGEKPKHDPWKWRRLGFTIENPEPDFEAMGYLGLMDLSDFVRRYQEEFQNVLVEQKMWDSEGQCPLAKVSLAITATLFEHFEIEKASRGAPDNLEALDSDIEERFQPLLLHWSRLHVAGLRAFLRLWKATSARTEEFEKINELIKILIESVVGGAERTKTIEAVELEMSAYELVKLRELQVELLDLAYEDLWGRHLRGTKDELQNEALQFVKEQRIRCLLQGSWFRHELAVEGMKADVQPGPIVPQIQGHRYIQLSQDRQQLHWGDWHEMEDEAPLLDSLPNMLSLSSISSVVSNITATGSPVTPTRPKAENTTTKITVHGYAPRTTISRQGHTRSASKLSNKREEIELLSFQPENHFVASEWLDGLLMLLDQQPITTETNKLIKMMSDIGLKIRLLNVRGNDEEHIIDGVDGVEAPPTPSREGLDEDYFYTI